MWGQHLTMSTIFFNKPTYHLYFNGPKFHLSKTTHIDAACRGISTLQKDHEATLLNRVRHTNYQDRCIRQRFTSLHFNNIAPCLGTWDAVLIDISFIYNFTHVTTITHNYFFRCVTFTQLTILHANIPFSRSLHNTLQIKPSHFENLA
jgi:hypothetical protein